MAISLQIIWHKQLTSWVISVNFTASPQARRRRALDRYNKLRPHLEADVPLKRVAAESGVPLRTAQRWVSRYRRLGLAGLSRAARADRGKGRRLSDELRQIAKRLALQRPALRPGAIYREVCRVACERGQEPPGYHTVYNVIRSSSGAPVRPASATEKQARAPADRELEETDSERS